MKKLETYPGDKSYMPVWKNDLMFLQEAYGESFTALCKALLGRDYGILTGCEVSATGISEGYVFFDGEIIYCPEQPSPGPGRWILKKIKEYDPEGDKVFKNAVGSEVLQEVRETYCTPYMKLQSIPFDVVSIQDSSGSDDSEGSGSENDGSGNDDNGAPSSNTENDFILLSNDGKKTLLELLHDSIGAIPYEVKEYNTWNSVNGVHIRYTRIGQQVFILSLSGNGSISISPVGGENNEREVLTPMSFTLPVGFRPRVNTYFVYERDSTGETLLGRVTPSGQILVGSDKNIHAVAFNFLTADDTIRTADIN